LSAQDTLRTYIFGHSLIHHEFQVNVTPSQETSVPHWFHFLAQEAGYDYEVAGQYGFLTTHVNLPASSQWGFDFVEPAWDDANESFGAADISNILLTPANFVQYQAPTLPYFNSTLTPLTATDSIFDWVNLQEDSLDLYVYENWPDMASFLGAGFPPTAAEWTAYNTYLNAGFHDWFIEYHDSLVAARPNQCVSMIPVGPIISGLLAQSPFDQIPIDSLYEDDAPHGMASTYFLAAMVTYMAMYQEQTPLTYNAPPIIHSTIRNNYSTVVTHIWNALQNFNFPNGDSRVFCTTASVLSLAKMDFSGLSKAGIVQLSWEAENNPQRASFRIEHRAGNDRWEELSQVPTQPAAQNYQFQHQDAVAHWNYYRLKEVSVDGGEQYSSVIKVWVDPSQIISIWPNPTKGLVEISGIDLATIEVLDVLGRKQSAWQPRGEGIDLGALPAAVYFLRTERGTFRVLKE
ncbi:MAG: T9SS type A sorting domain-containing protein, partial [Bacteroidota bacterium]